MSRLPRSQWEAHGAFLGVLIAWCLAAFLYVREYWGAAFAASMIVFIVGVIWHERRKGRKTHR